jgi:hypothetical protein
MIDFTKNSNHLKILQEEMRNPPCPLKKGESHQLDPIQILEYQKSYSINNS